MFAIDSNKVVLMVLLDLSAAFDTPVIMILITIFMPMTYSYMFLLTQRLQELLIMPFLNFKHVFQILGNGW